MYGFNGLKIGIPIWGVNTIYFCVYCSTHNVQNPLKNYEAEQTQMKSTLREKGSNKVRTTKDPDTETIRWKFQITMTYVLKDLTEKTNNTEKIRGILPDKYKL